MERRRVVKALVLALGCCLGIQANANAQLVEVVTAAAKKVIRQIDLKVQKLQNKTIWMQNAQKVIENKMAELKLDEIANWTEQQRDLFRNYYEELSKVKAAIGTYTKVRQVITQQLQIAGEYKKAYELVRQDKHFTDEEIAYSYKVYSGIIDESVQQLDELYIVINPYRVQMTDGKRLELIGNISHNMQRCLDDLRRFNRHTNTLSKARAAMARDNEATKKIYGLK